MHIIRKQDISCYNNKNNSFSLFEWTCNWFKIVLLYINIVALWFRVSDQKDLGIRGAGHWLGENLPSVRLLYLWKGQPIGSLWQYNNIDILSLTKACTMSHIATSKHFFLQKFEKTKTAPLSTCYCLLHDANSWRSSYVVVDVLGF